MGNKSGIWRFMGGFGKIFFTKGGIKRGFGVFLGWRGEMYLGGGEKERERGKE